MTIYSQISSNKVKTYFIMFFFVAFVSFFFYLIGKYMGDATFYFGLGLIISIASSIGSYFYSDKMVLAMSGAKLADKKTYFDLYTVTENMAIAAGLPMPKVYVIEDSAMNAFATGRDPKHAVVVATTGILHKLDRTELEGVIAHELSHIQNYDIRLMAVVTVLVGLLVFVADWITRSLMWGNSDDNSSGRKAGFVLFIIFMFITPIVATLIQLAVSRRREYLADASGALLNRNPDALAAALHKISADPHVMRTASNATAHLFIENPFKTDKGKKARSFIAGLFSTHPPVEERIRLLKEM